MTTVAKTSLLWVHLLADVDETPPQTKMHPTQLMMNSWLHSSGYGRFPLMRLRSHSLSQAPLRRVATLRRPHQSGLPVQAVERIVHVGTGSTIE